MNNSNIKRCFKPLLLSKIYKNKIRYKNTVGNDKINNRLFENNYRVILNKVYEKIIKGKYEFTSYREKLILKGKGKEPRVISIPTIRDKIVLSALKEYIFEKYKDSIDTKIVQTKVAELKKELREDKYNFVIRLDIVKYYDSINHDKLLEIMSKKIKDKRVLNLIKKAIENPTVPLGNRASQKNNFGIPQGLSISNVLASIYLMNLDEKFNKKNKIKYFRYVDDILILCNKQNKEKISEEVKENLSEGLGLKVHEEDCAGDKSYIKDIKDGFSYLGYTYEREKFSVRESTVKRFEKTIEDMFNNYKKSREKNLKQFELQLNLKITGVITEENEKYGWLFFFSQIEDKKILFHLDKLVEKFLKKNNLKDLKTKRFSRTFHEIIYNLKESNYLYKMKNITKEEKLETLKIKFEEEEIKEIEKNEKKINFEYKRLMMKIISGLERDLQNFS